MQTVTVRGRFRREGSDANAVPMIDLDTYVVGPEGRGTIGQLTLGLPLAWLWVNDPARVSVGAGIQVSGPLNVRKEEITVESFSIIAPTNVPSTYSVPGDTSLRSESGVAQTGLGAVSAERSGDAAIPATAVSFDTTPGPGVDPLPGTDCARCDLITATDGQDAPQSTDPGVTGATGPQGTAGSAPNPAPVFDDSISEGAQPPASAMFDPSPWYAVGAVVLVAWLVKRGRR